MVDKLRRAFDLVLKRPPNVAQDRATVKVSEAMSAVLKPGDHPPITEDDLDQMLEERIQK